VFITPNVLSKPTVVSLSTRLKKRGHLQGDLNMTISSVYARVWCDLEQSVVDDSVNDWHKCLCVFVSKGGRFWHLI